MKPLDLTLSKSIEESKINFPEKTFIFDNIVLLVGIYDKIRRMQAKL